MNDALLSVTLLGLGAILGLLSSLLISITQQRQSVTLKLLDQYLAVRKDVVDAVSDLTNLSIKNDFGSQQRAMYRDKVSKLFYMHYDFLPQAVLDSLILLYVCLDAPDRGLHTIKENTILPMDEQEVVPFIESCTLFANTALTAPMALKSRNPTIRANQVIRIHARHVLYTLNRFSSIDDLMRLAKNSKKVARA